MGTTLYTVLNKSLKQHPANSCTVIYILSQKQSTKSEQKCWKLQEKYKQIHNNFLFWTIPHGPTRIGRPRKTYIHQLGAYIECHLKDLPKAMANSDKIIEENQRNPCYRYALIMMMTSMVICMYIFLFTLNESHH